MKEKIVIVLMAAGIFLLGGAFIQRAEQEQTVYTMKNSKESLVVVIDAGHGGKDPRQGRCE